MESSSAWRGNALEDGLPQAIAKNDHPLGRAKDSDSQALFDRVVDRGADGRDGVEDRTGFWREPGRAEQHSILHTDRTLALPESMISVTRNELPPVSSYTSSGSTPVLSAIARTAFRDSRGSVMRLTPGALARSPSGRSPPAELVPPAGRAPPAQANRQCRTARRTARARPDCHRRRRAKERRRKSRPRAARSARSCRSPLPR